jgi:hypothetical protein
MRRDLRHAQPPVQLSPPHCIFFHLDRVFTEQDLLLGVQGVGGPLGEAVAVGVAGSDDCRDGDEQPRVSLFDILVILLYRDADRSAALTGRIIPNHLAARLTLCHSDDRR